MKPNISDLFFNQNQEVPLRFSSKCVIQFLWLFLIKTQEALRVF